MITKFLIKPILQMIQLEAFEVLFKLLVGIILTSTIIYSIIQLGEAYQSWLYQFENELVYSLISFALITLGCSAALYYVFNTKSKTAALQNQDQLNINPEIVLQNLAMKFLDGFVEGMEAEEKRDKREMLI